MKQETKTFEAAMERLREITEILEKGEETLENSIALFSEGASLSAFCYDTLKNAEQKLTMLGTAEENENAGSH